MLQFWHIFCAGVSYSRPALLRFQPNNFTIWHWAITNDLLRVRLDNRLSHSELTHDGVFPWSSNPGDDPFDGSRMNEFSVLRLQEEGLGQCFVLPVSVSAFGYLRALL
jgi:hypothetical protein